MNLSFSAGQKYKQCPKAYYFHYIRKLRPTGLRSPLVWGGAIDEGLNALLLGKDYKKEYTKAWEAFKKSNIKYSQADCGNNADLRAKLKENPDAKDTQREIWEELNNKGLIILDDYKAEIVPMLDEVISVQEKITLTNEEGDTFVGYVDLVARYNDEIVLFDNKTTSVTYKDDSVRTSEQLAIYYAALKEKYSLTKAGYIAINKRLRTRIEPATSIKVIVDDISQELIDDVYADYDLILDGIKDGEFERNFTGCITKYGKCDYYDYCHNGKKDGLSE